MAIPVQMGQSQPKRGDRIWAGSVCENTGAGSLRLAMGGMLSELNSPCRASTSTALGNQIAAIPCINRAMTACRDVLEPLAHVQHATSQEEVFPLKRQSST